MNAYSNAPVPAADRAEVTRLYAEAKRNGTRVDGVKIHDLLVSCYVGTGEGGGPEAVHETKISNGACRCGYYRPRHH
jgi:hypothetical protein